mgnify:CR=1 FL=1
MGFEIRDILLIVMVVLIGGKPVLNILALLPGLAPLAKILEKLTTNGNGKNGELKVMMSELQEHYNSDTTRLLEEIKEGINSHDSILKEMNERLAILVDRSK